jgi:hypothetical protein
MGAPAIFQLEATREQRRLRRQAAQQEITQTGTVVLN